MKPATPTGLAAALATLYLVGCSGAPSRAPVDGADSPYGGYYGGSAAPSKVRRPLALKKGGGYYKDDGPLEDIPDNIDEIPDAVPRLEPLNRFANKPYEVLGKEYVPNTSLQPYKAVGVASWYGKKFHGQKTSIGEPYDMFAMTAAHPTLAIPSYVRVTNTHNGRSVVVRVTDRGPFHADRVIDLSYTAAHKLGLVATGSGEVEVEAIVPDLTGVSYAQVAPPMPVRPSRRSNTAGQDRDELGELAMRLETEDQHLAGTAAAARALGPGVYLQLGAFSSQENAESLRARLARDLDWLSQSMQINSQAGIHRLQVGPYPNRAEADKVAERIRVSLGFKPTFVTR